MSNEGMKRTFAAAMTPLAAASGAVATPTLSPEARGIVNNGNPAIVRSIPPQKPSASQALQGLSKGVNSMGGAWADARSKAAEQSAKIDGANKTANALKGVSSSPPSKDTGRAANVLKSISSDRPSQNTGRAASALKGNSSTPAQASTGASNGQSRGGQGR